MNTPQLLLVLAAASATLAQTSTLMNPTGRAYTDDVLRLTTTAPGPTGTFTVKEDGLEIPYQVEQIGGKNAILVCSTFAPYTKHDYEVVAGARKGGAPKVTVAKQGDSYLLDNGIIAVKVPARAEPGMLVGPIEGIKLPNGAWAGGSAWHTKLPVTAFTSTMIGDGTVLGKIRLRYTFGGMAGIDKNIPAFAEVDVSLGPGWRHAAVFERHEMPFGDYWELEASKGWAPTQGRAITHSSNGFGPPAPPPNRELKPVTHISVRPGTYTNLFPRWNQHFKDGWYFGATDGAATVGCIVVRASQWIWPHENAIEGIVKDTGEYAGFRCPTWKGQRLWWLTAGATAPADEGYLTRYAYESLDKLNHEIIIDWPGKLVLDGTTKSGFQGYFPLQGGINPTGSIRGMGRNAIRDAGKPGGYGTFTQMQLMMHPDCYGNYWNFWSPENPNFATDFFKVPIAMTTNLKAHPQFETLRKAAEMKFREDLHHSIALPGGAGQECPGYMYYALEDNLIPLAKASADHLGFDPRTWERFQAGEHFLRRITQPDGAGQRLFLHMGDTHPGGHWQMDMKGVNAKEFVTEELPGFGVVFNNRPGTDRENYLAFKSGPNRGHYHGDQLSFHYAANAKRVAVDHHCSYAPRAGQEHMHNRVAFFTDEMPYANMDGYEHVIAFKTGANADVAIGQVESMRLRKVKELPGEDWDSRWPQLQFEKPLVYRRAIVQVKNGAHDYIVIRDQYWADRPLKAAFALHIDPDLAGDNDGMKQDGAFVRFTNGGDQVLSLFAAQPAKFTFASLNWAHNNGPRESTMGARLETAGATGEFITVLYPGKDVPAMTAIPGGVRVGDDEITFAGDQTADGKRLTVLTVTRAGKVELTMSGTDIDLNRSQGDIGLFVPDAGYPFGEIPDWLVRQRATRPDWAKGL